ncbi:MAG TPA: hypothetical protein VJ183_10135 [Chloroflexia bacterium]|nr:hypothetical protein [Chloroflexia bacterium]
MNDEPYNQDDDLLARAASRAAGHKHLFASILARYSALKGLDDESLRAHLKCDAATLNRLRLCGRPDPDAPAFAIDIQRIAERLDLDAIILAQLVREVDIAGAFNTNSQTATHGGVLQAARDHDEEDVAGESDEADDTEL